MHVGNAFDAVYLQTCLNLLNRYVEEDRTERYLTKRDLYMFKRPAAQVLEVLVTCRFEDTEVWIAGDVTYASMFGLQLSFHNLPRRPALVALRRARRTVGANGRVFAFSRVLASFSIGA
jgi:hypothetical protein